MQVSILGSGRRVAATGWSNEFALSLLGSLTLELPPPTDRDARLTGICLLGSLTILVTPGTEVSVGGISLVGSREIRISPATDASVHLRLFSLIGSVKVGERTGGEL